MKKIQHLRFQKQKKSSFVNVLKCKYLGPLRILFVMHGLVSVTRACFARVTCSADAFGQSNALLCVISSLKPAIEV